MADQPNLCYVYTHDGECAACGALLRFWRTPKGRSMPVNDDGRPLALGATMDPLEAREKLLPNVHFKTCTDPSRFRQNQGLHRGEPKVRRTLGPRGV